jgi:response regulator RpfG family c-di-GMP phosphodiesterase
MSTKLKVLYVDDEELNIMLFNINFSKKYEVFTALSGAEGLEVLDKEDEIAIVLSDLKMPALDGLGFIQQAKDKFPDKKYFLLTGFENTPEIQAAIDSGLILKYFRKPFDMEEIEVEFNKYGNG